jgi:hypothetical protein
MRLWVFSTVLTERDAFMAFRRSVAGFVFCWVCSVSFSFILSPSIFAQPTTIPIETTQNEVGGKIQFLGGSIVFPTKPEIVRRDLDTPQGTLVQKIFKFVDNDNRSVFMLQTIEYPDKKGFIADAAITSTIETLKERGQTKTEKDAKLGELKGKEIVVQRKDGAIFRSRVFVDQSKAVGYTIEVIGMSPEIVESSSANAFFESATH